MVTQFGPIWPTLGERAALQSTMRRCYKRLQEISLFPNLYPFVSLTTLIWTYSSEYTKEALDPSNDSISLPKVFTMFIPTLKTLLTKIFNPQVPPFVNSRPLASALLQKCCRTHLNTSHSSPKSRHSSVQSRHDFVWTAVVTSPFQAKLGEEAVESCHDFPSQNILLPANPIVSRCLKSWHDFRFPTNPIWSQYTTIF